jgi:hypothetical protein
MEVNDEDKLVMMPNCEEKDERGKGRGLGRRKKGREKEKKRKESQSRMMNLDHDISSFVKLGK